MLSKFEIKIFLTFFLIYSLFIQWPGWIDDSNFFLTRSIVENTTVNIDRFYNQTPDRSFHNGHYYSSRAPGLAFVGLPFFGVLK